MRDGVGDRTLLADGVAPLGLGPARHGGVLNPVERGRSAGVRVTVAAFGLGVDLAAPDLVHRVPRHGTLRRHGVVMRGLVHARRGRRLRGARERDRASGDSSEGSSGGDDAADPHDSSLLGSFLIGLNVRDN
jgi:hypothetical protein